MKAFLGLLLSFWAAWAPGSEPNTYRNVVVMIEASYAHAKPEIGAGIVVDETPARTVIVTALHIVQQRDTGEIASKIDVEFRTLRGEVFAGKVNKRYWDFGRDLAVVFVDRVPSSNMPNVLPPDRAIIAGGNAASFKASPVQILGAMGEKRWAAGVKNDRITSVAANELQIPSPDAEAGGSGGAIFDSLGRLVGMSTHMQAGVLYGLPMNTILGELQGWGIECGISIAPTGSASPDLLAGFQGRVKIATAYAASPKRGENIETGTQAFRNRVTASVPADMKGLKPVIELNYFPFPGRTTSLTLSSPDYSAEVVEFVMRAPAQYWIVLSDGRKLGPLTTELDFETGVTAAAERLGPVGRDNLKMARILEDNARRQNAAFAEAEARRQANLKSVQADIQTQMDSQHDAFNLQGIDRTVAAWRLQCGQRDDRWICTYPMLPSYIEHLVRSLKLGPSSADMAVNVTGNDTQQFRDSFSAGAARVLQENADASGVYARLELTNGRVFEAKPLCLRSGPGCR